MKLSEFYNDSMVINIISTLTFNILIAGLYMLIFAIIKAYCSKTDRQKATKLIDRRNGSFLE